MSSIVVIAAGYESVRLPGKSLLLFAGQPAGNSSLYCQGL
jgi:CMP-2-keto-3-deoxyoctulosonic acid synthetase